MITDSRHLGLKGQGGLKTLK